MKVFCTGATGFIGSHVVKKLLSQGHKLLCLRRHTSDTSRIDDPYNKITWITNDNGWIEDVKRFAPDIIIHMAWAGVHSSTRDNWRLQFSNIDFTLTLLEIARNCNVKKFIGLGSQAEYGILSQKVDETCQTIPINAYGAAKLATLDMLRTFSESFNISWYWFRIFSLFGDDEDDGWFIPSLVKSILKSEPMDLTEGLQKIAYLHVDECAKAIISPITKESESGIYNISGNKPLSIRDITLTIQHITSKEARLNFGAIPYRTFQSMHIEGDTNKISNKLYCIDNSNFESSFRETILKIKTRLEK